MKSFFTILFFGIQLIGFSQNKNESIDFIEICKTILSVKEFEDLSVLTEQKNTNTIFIETYYELYQPENYKFSFPYKNYLVAICMVEELFANNIEYFIYFKSIQRKNNGIIKVDFVTNNQTFENRKSTYSGTFKLKSTLNGFKIISYRIEDD